MDDTSAYFLPDGERFVPGPMTRGPWSAQHQHGGPPAALLARQIERRAPETVLARMTVDFLKPVPIAPLSVKVEVLRAGRKVERVMATLLHEGDAVAHAVAVQVRPQGVDVPAPRERPDLPLPEPLPRWHFPFFPQGGVSYDTSVDVRIARGVFGSGAVFAWMRQVVPLLPGEAPSPMQRVLVVADSGSGVGAALDRARFRFVNADLTVHLHRPPDGDWIGLDALTALQPIGLGLTDTRLFDTRGPIGRADQGLVLEAVG
jgi:hypothetical protein